MPNSKLLIIDFYDSFTYNLQHYFASMLQVVDVVYFDKIQEIDMNGYDLFVLSPGPGLPKQKQGIKNIIGSIMSQKKPLLGVCLGFQALAEILGAELKNQDIVKHGVSETIQVVDSNSILFQGIPKTFKVGLYHSWKVDAKDNLQVTAISENNITMAFEDADKKLFGIQFHPESILTENGLKILQNFCQFK